MMLPATKRNCLATAGYSKLDLEVHIYDILDTFLAYFKVYFFSVVIDVSRLLARSSQKQLALVTVTATVRQRSLQNDHIL